MLSFPKTVFILTIMAVSVIIFKELSLLQTRLGIQMHNKSLAFSLSEILIALMVIGVIAAFTIPVIFANYQKEQAKSALKKNYSSLKQALDYYYINNGISLYSSDIDVRKMKTYLMNYFNILKDCGNCKCYYTNTDVQYLNYTGKESIDYKFFDDGQFILADGTFVLMENPAASNNNDSYGRSKYISVDINGLYRKPNILGKDLFMFQLMENGELLPMGDRRTDYDADNYCSNKSTSNMNGAGCTYKLLYE